MRLFFLIFLLNGDSESESQISLGVLGILEPDLFGKSGVLGSEKSIVLNHRNQEKHPRGWRGGLSTAGLGTTLSCSRQSQGMHLAKGKDVEKLTRVQRKAQE